MQQYKKGNKLQHAFVLVRCNHPGHKHCGPLRDAVLKNKSVVQAYTATTNIKGKEYCVSAKALVPENGVSAFKKSLKDTVVKRNNKEIKVQDSKVLIKT